MPAYITLCIHTTSKSLPHFLPAAGKRPHSTKPHLLWKARLVKLRDDMPARMFLMPFLLAASSSLLSRPLLSPLPVCSGAMKLSPSRYFDCRPIFLWTADSRARWTHSCPCSSRRRSPWACRTARCRRHPRSPRRAHRNRCNGCRSSAPPCR